VTSPTKRQPTNVHLTDTRVRKLQPREKLYRIWDMNIPGFHVQVTPKGSKSFRVQFQRSNGKKVQVTIGDFPSLDVESAREKAQTLRRMHRDGRDVRAHMMEERSTQEMWDLVKIWERDFAPLLKKTTKASYDSILRTTILPALGSRLVKDISYEDVRSLYQNACGPTPTQAGRAVAVLSRLLTIAEIQGWRPDGTNPCRKVTRLPDKPRKRILTVDELARLETAMVALVSAGKITPANADLIRFIAFSGLRRSEAMRLAFADIDIQRNTMTFQEHKTDRSGDKVLPLNNHLRSIIKRHQAAKLSPYLFPGLTMDKPFNGLGKVWERICVKAKLQDLTPHDLRRTFMSTCTELGYPIAVGDTLLGHSLGKIRDTYTQLQPNGIMGQASQETADWISEAMRGRKPKVGEKVTETRNLRSTKTGKSKATKHSTSRSDERDQRRAKV